ncbi:hypothetical protein TraAM80_04181 [Trypanosoma rangeli]|uniref:Uncharacterized protein n=1 Tax=Trypanosoma rangeli TaxID=5698 RepID=A0A3R7LYY2_TRYRA|nr:uncharacterized protein TraAM80_04181 [Trypanosoma rangeli]RNF06027.1 hypothetical protein TraAM80_04181 [Trypanosoma rangeli]|eukprot:RNF06027.1 hypothetical protein TraAM80_04181 [Trypanosoma rangeli]
MDAVQHLLYTLCWVYGVASWCMCFYVFFSSGEGYRWFTTLHNYLLILGATGAAAAAVFLDVPSTSIFLTFSGWSFYAMLVTAHYWRFRLWRRHIIPVTVPLLFLFAWEAKRTLTPAALV